jgi:hypothetical protein
MQKLKLNEYKNKLICEFEDSFGGCYHEINVKTLSRILKPAIKMADKLCKK